MSINILAIGYKAKMILLEKTSTFLNKLFFLLAGVKYGNGFHSVGYIFTRNLGAIELGSNVNVNSSHEANPIGGSRTTLFTCFGATIKIGDNTGISNTTIYAKKSVLIGKSVFIGAGTKIYDTDFHSVVAEYRLHGNINIPSSPVVIKDESFIGANCLILKGVTIGKKSVVGAGSIVTKSIPDGEIWAGVPARFIKNVNI